MGYYTIITTPEIKKDGYLFCGKCNTKLMLVATSGYWDVDEEAFKSGVPKPEKCPDEVFVGEISGHFCTTCEELTSLSYNH